MAETVEEASMGSMASLMDTTKADVIETRDFPDKGELLGWASSEIKDAHGTRIDPAEVLKHLQAGHTDVDQEHDFKATPGVRIVEVHPAKRPMPDADGGSAQTMDGVSFTVRCDLAVDAARELFERFKSGAYKGFSIAFRIADDLRQRIADGVTDIIDRIEDIPFVSAVAEPSNGAALLLEMRGKIQEVAAVAAQTVTTADTMDRLDLLRQDVAALAQDASVPVSAMGSDEPPTSTDAAASVEPVSSPAPEVAAWEARCTELAGRIESLAKDLEELRGSSPSWATDAEAIRASLGGLIDTIADQGKRLDQVIDVVRSLVPEVRRYVDGRMAALRAPERRKGIDPGAAAMNAAVAKLEKRAETKREDDHLTRVEELLHGL